MGQVQASQSPAAPASSTSTQDDTQPTRDCSNSLAVQQQSLEQALERVNSGASPNGLSSGPHVSKRYQVQEVMSKGSYGVVFAAVDTETGARVAIRKTPATDPARTLQEIQLLRMLKHQDVVEIKHVLLPPDSRTKDIYVVFELLESDLHTVLQANDDLTHDHHKVFLYQLLRGLDFIHSSGMLHRNLKPKNILASSNCKLKICDFERAQSLRPSFSDPTSASASCDSTRWWYRAPELCGCFNEHHTQAVDMWSMGCIFAEMLLGRPLFPGSDAVSQLEMITDLLGKPTPAVIERVSNEKARTFLAAMAPKPPIPLELKFPDADKGVLALLQKLIAFDPADRPTAAEALQDPYFAGLRDAMLSGKPTEPAS